MVAPEIRSRLKSVPALLALASVFIGAEYLLFGKYGALFIGDNADIFFPQFISAGIDGVGAGWNRFAAAGSDRVTEGANTFANLWLYTILPPWLAQQVVVLSMVAAAVVGGYALCRRTLGVSFWPALFGGCACATLPYGMLVYNAQAWTPALIAATGFVLAAPRRPER